MAELHNSIERNRTIPDLVVLGRGGGDVMTDQQLAVQAVSAAQRIVEEYLEPRPHDNERLLDRLVEILDRPDLVVAVSRLQRNNDR